MELPPGFIFFQCLHISVKVAAMNNNPIALVLRPRQITIGNWMTYRRVIRFDVKMIKGHNKIHRGKEIDFLICCTINYNR